METLVVRRSIMSVWLLCALLSSLICQTEQDEHPLSIKVYAEETDRSEYGAWVLIVEWRDGSAEKNEPSKVSYDVEIYHTENMTIVHNETIHVTQDNTTHHHLKWTSPIPLQCTSHSVRLRRRDQNHTGEWTPFSLHKGQELNDREMVVYPYDQFFVVGSNVTFCCIMKTVPLVSSTFIIPISNWTYISKPVHFHSPSITSSNVRCDDNNGVSAGASVFIGYPPDDQNLSCMTRDLSSVECHWERGRSTYLESYKTIYTLNGRVCDFDKCVLLGVPMQLTNWTLIAKNPLGVKTLTDTADPTHRVWLNAPSNLTHAAYARNVTLLWSWNVENYKSFPMICHVNGSIDNKNFSGVGLSSIDLVHLQPFTKYTVKVKCGSSEHLYKWSDESEITFSTTEDIPEAVDVWIQYFEQNTYVLSKPLTPQQSHGMITQFEITKGKRRKIIDVGPNTELCYKITPGNKRNDQNITVSARNSAGLSPPSTIIVPGYPDNEVVISQIGNHTGGFKIVWDKYFNSTCGYVVEWFPTDYETQCAVEWTKIPECDHATCCSWKQYDIFKAGVKYTLSVYACIDDKPVLLQRHEGYAEEQRPSGTVQKLRSYQNGENLELSWDEVPVKQQNGFILGYKVITFHSDSKTYVNTAMTKEPKVNLTLDRGTYTFSVSAFTSGGDGDNATLGVEVKNETGQIITTIMGCSAATLIFIIITVLCFRKRKWLKKILYPDIPEPKLAGKWNTKGIYCTQMTEGYMKCEIQEVYSSERSATAESQHGLISSDSNQNTCKFPVDVSHNPPPWPCAEKLISIIENPSYNMTFPEPVDVVQIAELTLEMQDSYLPAPNFVQKNVVVKDSSGYKPQSA